MNVWQVCRTHEMRALRAGGAPPWRWLPRSALLLDSTLQEAERDLRTAFPHLADRVAAGAVVPEASAVDARAASELRRVGRLRNFVCGPLARVAHLGALLLLPALAASAVARQGLAREHTL